MVRRLIPFLFALVALGACSDGEFLEGSGAVGNWIAAAAPSTTAAPAPTTSTLPPPPIRPTAGMVWSNDTLSAGITDDTAALLAAIWGGTSRSERFVQAARQDIARVLPGVGFPSMLPEDGAFISSQLVFSPSTGSLAEDLVAAFGVWTVEPYSQSRELAQRAVLFVGRDDIDRAALAADPANGCSWFRDRDPRSCEPGPEDLGPSWWLETFEGETLVWLDGVYRYELRARGLDRPVVEVIGRSMAPLAELGSPVIGPAGSTSSEG